MRIRGSSDVESVFLPVLGELALISLPVGACVPRGRLEPFFLLVSPALTVDELVPPPSLFILLIISRTDLGLSLETVVVCFSLVSTLVTSPDLRSTPTIDQGRGLGRGLGLGLKWVLGTAGEGVLSSAAAEVGKVLVLRGLASGDGEAFFSKLNLVDLKPTMDPLGSSVFGFSSISLGVEVVIGEAENSLVGEVKLAAKPVDLLIQKHTKSHKNVQFTKFEFFRQNAMFVLHQQFSREKCQTLVISQTIHKQTYIFTLV